MTQKGVLKIENLSVNVCRLSVQKNKTVSYILNGSLLTTFCYLAFCVAQKLVKFFLSQECLQGSIFNKQLVFIKLGSYLISCNPASQIQNCRPR